MSEAVKLTTSENVVLGAIRALVPAAGGRLPQAKIRVHTGKSISTISKALTGLETKGQITLEKAKAQGVPSFIVPTSVSSQRHAQDGGSDGAIPDCFRVADFSSAGILWQRAPKGKSLTKSQLLPYAATGPESVTRHLKALAELPGPVVTIKPHATRKGWYAYTLHELTDEQQQTIFDHLSGRLKRYQPKTRAGHQAELEAARGRLRETFGAGAYVDLAPGILAQCKVGPEYRTIKILLDENDKPYTVPHVTRCRTYGGDLSASGYGEVEGVRSPGIMAHRIVYHAHHGAIAHGMEVHHMCRNRACCEVEHLSALYPDEHYQGFTVWGTYRNRMSQIDKKHENGSDEWRAARAAASDWLHKQTELEVPIGTARPTNTN